MAIFPQFGKQPSGARLARIQQSPNFKNNRFENIDFTPNMSEEFSASKLLKSYISPIAKEPTPINGVPFEKNNLHQLLDNSLVWFGHSSYLLKFEGLTFLIDPVFSGSASPFSFNIKSFKGSNEYQVEDMPAIDYLIISHDHYDHLDYKTILALKSKVGHIICGLGVGEHFEFWGYSPELITELDWHEQIQLKNNVKIRATPARHFSGRGFKRNNTLFCSYILSSESQQLFLGGDSGYGSHFKTIGEQYGPFDFGILECGQYNVMWKEIHTRPNEWAKVISDLKLKSVMPVHFGKFKLALHDWNEPVQRFSEEVTSLNIPFFTPKIGAILQWNQPAKNEKWWI